jgi:nucleoside-diphosphate-sugar epimerase
MRILVTGATGGLGRNAVDCLLAQGLEVHATGRNTQIGQLLASKGVVFTAIDLALASPEQLACLLGGVDVVWHCAALSSPWGPRRLFEASNVTATARLLDASGTCGVQRFVHISTPAIYFDYTHRYQVEENFRAATFANDYARTKAAAEAAARTAFPGMLTTILRPRAIFGPHDQVLLPRLMQLMRASGGRLPLPRGGEALIDMTYVENVVAAMWLATVTPGLAPGLELNITNDAPRTIAHVLQKLFVDGLGHNMRIRKLPYPVLALAARGLAGWSALSGKEPRITPYSVGVLAYDMTLSLDRAKRTLAYAPPVSLDEGIERTVSWIKRHG